MTSPDPNGEDVQSRSVSPIPQHQFQADAATSSSAGLSGDITAAPYQTNTMTGFGDQAHSYSPAFFAASQPPSQQADPSLFPSFDVSGGGGGGGGGFMDQFDQQDLKPLQDSFAQFVDPGSTTGLTDLGGLYPPQAMANVAVGPPLFINSQVQQLAPQRQQESSPSPLSPPGSTNSTYYTPQHSRHSSFEPPLMGGGTEWPDMIHDSSSFSQYQQAPSEVSDVSSAAALSPYTSQLEPYDTSDNNNPSPLLPPTAAENDPSGIYDTSLGMDSFTISDNNQLSSSPYISPQLLPQQDSTADMGQMPNFLSAATTASNVKHEYSSPSTDMYYDAPGLATDASQDIGQASQMAPPSINVELAPPSRVPTFGPAKPPADTDSLSPPASNPREFPL